MPGKDRAHYKGDYPKRAKAVRDAAYADPTTRCWRCGGLLGKDTWDAGHLIDGSPLSPLAAEHATCNRSAGSLSKWTRPMRSKQWG